MTKKRIKTLTKSYRTVVKSKAFKGGHKAAFFIMKTIIRDFFISHGAELTESGEKFIIKLPELLQKDFGQETLELVFDPQYVDEKTELVTHGSYVLHVIHRYLQDFGIKIVSRLPEKFSPEKDVLASKIKVQNGKALSLKTKKLKNIDVLFNFKATYLSDEKAEDIISVATDPNGVVFDPAEYYNEAVLNKLISLQQKGAIEITHKEIELYFRECLKTASSRAKQYGQSLQDEILKRLHRNVTRLKGYYGAQIEEVNRGQPSYEEKRIGYEREYQSKLKEEIENHRLRIVLKLISYHIIERTDIEIFFDLEHSDKSKIPMKALFDSFTGKIDHGSCPSCKQLITNYLLLGSSKMACDRCVFICSKCKTIYPDKNRARHCVTCSTPICDKCLAPCQSCGNAICDAHTTVCHVGKELLCEDCKMACEVCATPLCKDHSFECSATKAPVCFEHRIICKGCRKIYSKKFVDGLKKKKICPTCNSPL